MHNYYSAHKNYCSCFTLQTKPISIHQLRHVRREHNAIHDKWRKTDFHKTCRLIGPCKLPRSKVFKWKPYCLHMHSSLSLWCILWILRSFSERSQFVIGDSRIKLKLVTSKYDTNISVQIYFTRLWTSKSAYTITATPLSLLSHHWFSFLQTRSGFPLGNAAESKVTVLALNSWYKQMP